MRRSLVAVGLFVLVACGQSSDDTREQTATTRQNLIAEPEKYTGADLGDHELVFTFDDGPGPMDVTGALASFLASHKDPKTGAAQPIQSTFFVNGACVAKTNLSNQDFNASCFEPTPNADGVLARIVAEGHYVANHTTTHRDLPTAVPAGQLEAELSETDDLIKKYLVWNRTFFRAPHGNFNETVFNKLNAGPMKKYAGPIYWSQGGGPTDANRAADWECWEVKSFTTKQCGDRYLKEIKALGNKGIVLFHDAKGDTANHELTTGVGNTADMVKYIVSELDKDATPWKYKRLEEVPSIAEVLPKCDASCAQCSGPEADKCTACSPDKHIEGGKCVAGAGTADGGTSQDGGGSSSSSSSGSSSSGDNNKGTSSGSTTSGGEEAAAPPAEEEGCNTTGKGGASAVLIGLAAAALLRPARRRRRV